MAGSFVLREERMRVGLWGDLFLLLPLVRCQPWPKGWLLMGETKKLGDFLSTVVICA